MWMISHINHQSMYSVPSYLCTWQALPLKYKGYLKYPEIWFSCALKVSYYSSQKGWFRSFPVYYNYLIWLENYQHHHILKYFFYVLLHQTLLLAIPILETDQRSSDCIFWVHFIIGKWKYISDERDWVLAIETGSRLSES